ncbi:Protoheme IX farnesyltransferase, mitochondrial [Coemansia sp. RSA 25]|nr:Protoheme IX farnesyltransferase, mitochondrial [Coemansia sp. RSA 25]
MLRLLPLRALGSGSGSGSARGVLSSTAPCSRWLWQLPRQRIHATTMATISANGGGPRRIDLPWRIQSSAGGADLLRAYADLGKGKLTAFVVLTAMAGYAVAPGAAQVAPLLWTAAGTALCAGSANAFNQWIEAPYDAQMSRTRNRPLARHALAPGHALGVGVAAGAAGVGALWALVNPVAAALGAANIALYAGAYTALKRVTIANTWVGALVGAVPPVLGWVAASGGALGPGAWVMGGILFAWQFAQVNALAHTLRADYSKAGYRMMSVTRCATRC